LVFEMTRDEVAQNAAVDFPAGIVTDFGTVSLEEESVTETTTLPGVTPLRVTAH
jgi:hypothetical protein